MLIFAFFGLLFLLIGLLLFIKSDTIQEANILYNEQCGEPEPYPTDCIIELTLSEDIKGPVYVYYELHNFY